MACVVARGAGAARSDVQVGGTMKSARGVVTAAIILAGLRGWQQLRGTTKTPFQEWAVGFGALFFLLALLSEAAPGAASGLAWTVVVGDFLVNGTSLFTDVSQSIQNASKPGAGPVFTGTPFAASSQASAAASTNGGKTKTA